MAKNYLRIFVVLFVFTCITGLTTCESFRKSKVEESKKTGNSTAEPTINSQKLAPPVKFLLIGDSLMREGFGPALESSLLGYKDVRVVREGVYSTGLNKTDFFDWSAKAEELVAINKPDILIVTLGANDGQGILDNVGNAHELGTEGWRAVYAERVSRFLIRISQKVKKIFWIGHPIPGGDKFMRKFSVMNSIYQSETAKFPNAIFVNTWECLSVNGVYQKTLPDENRHLRVARQGDGVHVTNFGGKIMANHVVKAILQNIDLKQ